MIEIEQDHHKQRETEFSQIPDLLCVFMVCAHKYFSPCDSISTQMEVVRINITFTFLVSTLLFCF